MPKSIKKVAMTSEDIPEEKMVELKQIFPSAFAEGKINWEKLKLTLGAEIDEKVEKYGLSWAGKANAFKAIRVPATGTLIPQEKESVDWDKTENVFIEGDNLEVLKLLQKHYREQIKMIYIDPPYNTGKDFIYKDNFTENTSDYYERTGQSKDGVKLTSNLESNGRYHSDWLTMMYPRLFLARNLLREDGVIFVSIDDNEVANLRLIMDEIFGEENFVAQIVIDGTPKNDPYVVSTSHEYCIVYVKNLDAAKLAGYGLTNPHYSAIQEIWVGNQPDYKKVESKLKEYFLINNLKSDNLSNYKFADEDGVYRIGPIDDPQNSGPKDVRLNPLTGKPCKIPNRGWSCTIDTWSEWIEDNLIQFPHDDMVAPSKKTYIYSDRTDVLRSYNKVQTRKDTDHLKRLFGTPITPFSNPKPRSVIYDFVKNCNDKNLTVLDFFAGSGTVGEAVFQINAQDDGKRNFICVQLPEMIKIEGGMSNKEKKVAKAAIDFLTSINKPLNVAEISRERIRRAGEQFSKGDIGFKSYELSKSNYRQWNTITDKDDEQKLKTQMQLFLEKPLVDGYDEESVVYEVLVKEGFSLNSQVSQSVIPGKLGIKVWQIIDGERRMFVTFAKKLTQEQAGSLGLVEKDIFVCLDSALDDTTKVNLVRNFNLRVI